jgi:hypothetical protein
VQTSRKKGKRKERRKRKRKREKKRGKEKKQRKEGKEKTKIEESVRKIRGEGRRDFGGIFRISSTDATSSDSRVGGDCGAGEIGALAIAGMRAGEIRGVGRLPRVARVEKGRRHDDRVLRN